ncbi:hypothetical protein TNCV_4444911 [Trichonephila clavipes]|nr:hypothetical protein TNCV_4444911 [Trichonephila clavipes]
MLCSFSNRIPNEKDYIEIHRTFASKINSFSGKLEQKSTSSPNGQILWQQEFSLYFELGCKSKKIILENNKITEHSPLIGYVTISDDSGKSTVKVNDESDIQLKSLNELANDLTHLLDPKYTFLADVHLK